MPKLLLLLQYMFTTLRVSHESRIQCTTFTNHPCAFQLRRKVCWLATRTLNHGNLQQISPPLPRIEVGTHTKVEALIKPLIRDTWNGRKSRIWGLHFRAKLVGHKSLISRITVSCHNKIILFYFCVMWRGTSEEWLQWRHWRGGGVARWFLLRDYKSAIHSVLQEK